jgi:Predicted transcriptional regulators
VEIREMSIDDIVPYDNNPRNNSKAVEYVANSIRQFGFKVPIVVDKNNVVVAGHTRLMAAKELGLETVPAVVADDLTEEQVKAFRIADNKTAEQSDWNLLRLSKEIIDIDIDLEDFGFGEIELDNLESLGSDFF